MFLPFWRTVLLDHSLSSRWKKIQLPLHISADKFCIGSKYTGTVLLLLLNFVIELFLLSFLL
jgi:hypothetical protein